jgi:flagellar hook-length control protein FliK
MNVLPQASVPSGMQAWGPAAPAAAQDAGGHSALESAANAAFAQLWEQQNAPLAGADEALLGLDAEPAGLAAEATPVPWGDVLPALHLPAQITQQPAWQTQRSAAEAALGLDADESLEWGEDAAALPAMQALSPLPVVHPHLRRAEVASVDVSHAQAPLLAHVADAVSRSHAQVDASVLSAVPPGARSAATTSAAASLAASHAPASPLVQVLAQRIQLQQVQGQEVVTVRLDPPQWGSVEIRIQQDAMGVQVHLHASHAEVGRQLMTVADGLRQELQSRTAGEAQVSVAHSQRATTGQGNGQGEHPAHSPYEVFDGEEPVSRALHTEGSDDWV